MWMSIFSFKMIVLPFLLLSFIASRSDATLCYQCSDAKSLGNCAIDVKGLLADRDKFYSLINGTNIITWDLSRKFSFVKNCSEEWGEQCLIEEVKNPGTTQLKSFLRGCTKENIPSDNQTKCEFKDDVIVCKTSCKTDFCNGPQPSMSFRCYLSFVLTVTMYALHLIVVV